jgi:hypothetical protein
MALSDLAVFSEYVYSSLSEVIAQQVELFNAASGGAIVLRQAANEGDYSDIALWAKVAGLVRRRNAYGSGAVAAKELEHLIDTMVKVAAGTPPVNIPPSMFTWIQRNQEEGGAVIGQQLAGDMLGDMLNTAIMGYVAALSGEADVTHDYSATGTLDLSVLNTGASKFGDRANDLRAWVLHSKSMFDMFGAALANTEALFNFGTVNIRQDGFGRPFVITDSSALVNTTPNPDVYRSLGLVTGGIIVEANNDFDDNIETSNGDENIQRTYQAEWTYNLGIKGYSWDKTSGGKSPNDAALATANNWDRYATSHKDTAGVIVLSQ